MIAMTTTMMLAIISLFFLVCVCEIYSWRQEDTLVFFICPKQWGVFSSSKSTLIWVSNILSYSPFTSQRKCATLAKKKGQGSNLKWWLVII